MPQDNHHHPLASHCGCVWCTGVFVQSLWCQLHSCHHQPSGLRLLCRFVPWLCWVPSSWKMYCTVVFEQCHAISGIISVLLVTCDSELKPYHTGSPCTHTSPGEDKSQECVQSLWNCLRGYGSCV